MKTTVNLNVKILSVLALSFFFFLGIASAQDQTFGGTRIRVIAAGDTGFVVKPPHAARHGRKPVVWYAPTIGKYPNINTVWILERLVKKGFWVCGINVGESWGSPKGRKVYSAFYDTIMSRFNLDRKVCLIPQSRGGLMLYCWA